MLYSVAANERSFQEVVYDYKDKIKQACMMKLT